MTRYLIFTILAVTLVSFPIASFSQEEMVPMTEEAEYGYGTVMEVKEDSNEIVISEYDWESDGEVEIIYSIHADTVVENMDAWQNIPSGTYVDIEYVVDENGKRIANYITAYEQELTEPEME